MTRSQFPQDPVDRITDLEREVERLRAELRGLVGQRAGRNLQRPLFKAITAEWYDGSAYSYPSQTDLEIPILFQSWELNSGVPTYTGRSEYATNKAFCPFGWYPPGVNVLAYWTGKQYVIAEAPKNLIVRNYETITAASWTAGGGDCSELTLGSGGVYVMEDTGSVWEPLEYESGTKVSMDVVNVADSISDTKGLIVSLLDSGEWAVTVESCDITCAES